MTSFMPLTRPPNDVLREEDWDKVANNVEYLEANITPNPFAGLQSGSLPIWESGAWTGVAPSGVGIFYRGQVHSVPTNFAESDVLVFHADHRWDLAGDFAIGLKAGRVAGFLYQ